MEIDVHGYKLECCAKIFGLPFYFICLEFYKCGHAKCFCERVAIMFLEDDNLGVNILIASPPPFMTKSDVLSKLSHVPHVCCGKKASGRSFILIHESTSANTGSKHEKTTVFITMA